MFTLKTTAVSMYGNPKEKIIDSLMPFIQAIGLDNLTMETVAEYTGVTRKTLYNHFQTKSNLVDAIVNFWLKEVIGKLEQIAEDPDRNYIDKLNMIISIGFEEMRRGGLMVKKPGAIWSDPRVPSVHREIRQMLRNLIARIVKDATESGFIKDDIPRKNLSWVLINMIEGLLFLDEIEEPVIPKITLLRDSLRVVMEGILTESGSVALQSSPLFVEGDQS